MTFLIIEVEDLSGPGGGVKQGCSSVEGVDLMGNAKKYLKVNV